MKMHARRCDVRISVAGHTSDDAHCNGIVVMADGHHFQLKALSILVSGNLLLHGICLASITKPTELKRELLKKPSLHEQMHLLNLSDSTKNLLHI